MIRPSSENPRVLAPEEAEELMQHVAQLVHVGFPLAAGMRAAAEDCGRSRVADSLRQIAERLDQGESLSTILQDSGTWLPPYVAGLIVAAVRTGRLGEALLELVEQQTMARSLRRGLWQALSYPLTIAALALLWAIILGGWLSYTWENLIEDFGWQLPLATRHLVWWRDTGLWLVGGGAIVVSVAVWVFRRMRGAAAWARLLSTFPLFGPLWHARGLAEWAGIMSVLLKNRIPLPDAILWSGEAVSNPWVAERCCTWARQAAAGAPLSEVLSSRGDFPAALSPVIQWGERHGSLAEATATGREILARRVRIRTELLQSILPPLLFVMIGCCVLALAVALFMPIVTLFQSMEGLL